MEEIWKPIAEYNEMRPNGVPRYEVSTLGNIREAAYYDEGDRHHKAKEVKQHVDAYGYPYVYLTISNLICRKFCVHGLVAVTFAANPYRYWRVRHKDGNKSNNRVDNVEFVEYAGTTIEHNNWREQMLKVGSSSGRAVRQYTFDGRLIGEFLSSLHALEIIGVSTLDIESCCREKPKGKLFGGYAWRYMDDDELFGVDTHERRILIGVRAVRRYTFSGEVTESASIKTAAHKCQVPEKGIKACCERQQVRCGEYVWRYWDDDEFENGASVYEYIRSHDKRRKL